MTRTKQIPGVASPLIKYPGGKRWVIPRIGDGIKCYLTGTGGYFVDPFFGGGALPLWLGWPRMVLSDLNTPVMEMYQTVCETPGQVAMALSGLCVLGLPDDSIPGGITEDDFYLVRDWRPTTPVKRAAQLLYMSRLGYNGLWRVNRSGEFNVPYGQDSYRESIIERGERDAITSLFPNKEKFIKVGQALEGADLGWCDFEQVIDQAESGDLVYGDPPYDQTFDQYTAEPFSKGAIDSANQERLGACLRRATQRGVAVIAHNSGTDLVRKLYQGFTLIEAPERRSINRDGQGRGKVPCLIITNVPDLITP